MLTLWRRQSGMIRKTSRDIDEHLIKQSKNLLGTVSDKEATVSALLEIVRRNARREEVRVLSNMDGIDMAEKESMAKAWHS